MSGLAMMVMAGAALLQILANPVTAVANSSNNSSNSSNNSNSNSSPRPPNVVLIIVDDLKPSLGCYGDKQAVTPNIDKLAQRGARFRWVYSRYLDTCLYTCTVPATCTASRRCAAPAACRC